MARIRTIKPEFYTDEDLAERSIWARFIFPALWQHCDCEGRMEDRPKYLKTQLLPYDDQDLNALLDELAEHGFIVRYQVDGKRYIFVPNFTEHQRLSGKEASGTSEFPPCPNASQNEPEPNGEALVKQQGSDGERQESQEGKGKEGKGKEGVEAQKRQVVRFVPPTLDDLSEYMAELGLPTHFPQKFLDYYEAQGWKLSNGVKMADWRATCRTWKTRDKEQVNGKPTPVLTPARLPA